jgi:hypothetical protein
MQPRLSPSQNAVRAIHNERPDRHRDETTVEDIYAAYDAYFAEMHPAKPSNPRPSPNDAFYPPGSRYRHMPLRNAGAAALPRPQNHQQPRIVLGSALNPRSLPALVAPLAPRGATGGISQSARVPQPPPTQHQTEIEQRPLITQAQGSGGASHTGEASTQPNPLRPTLSAAQTALATISSWVPQRRRFIVDQAYVVLQTLHSLHAVNESIARGPVSAVQNAVLLANKMGAQIERDFLNLQKQAHDYGMFLVVRCLVPVARDALVDHMRAVLHRLRQNDQSLSTKPTASLFKALHGHGVQVTLAGVPLDLPLALGAMQRIERTLLDPAVIFQMCQFYREISRLAGQSPSHGGLRGLVTASPMALGKDWHDRSQQLWDRYQISQRQGATSSDQLSPESTARGLKTANHLAP